MYRPINATPRDFVVARQETGFYTVHIFESQEQFKNWRTENTGSFIAPKNARGRLLNTEDHRDEFEYA